MTKIAQIHEIYQFLVYPFCGMKLFFFIQIQPNSPFLLAEQRIL
jgi:hypothetical protein